MSDEPKKKHIALTSRWRAPDLPGVNSTVPEGGKWPPIGRKTRAKLTKFLRTFDNARTVKALAPYAESADEFVEALLAELAARGFEVGPSVAAIVVTAAKQMMWGEYFSSVAEATVEKGDEKLDPKLVTATLTALDQARANIFAAHDLHGRLAAEAARGALLPPDPLASFRGRDTLPAPAEPSPEEDDDE